MPPTPIQNVWAIAEAEGVVDARSTMFVDERLDARLARASVGDGSPCPRSPTPVS